MAHEGTELDLLRACRRGDESAARSLHALVAPGLIVYARSILHDHALAEDAVQGVFIRLLRADGETTDAVRDVRAWLTLLTRRESLSLLRARRRASVRERAHAADRVASTACSARREDSLIHDGELARAVNDLPRRLREIIILRHASQMSFDQIAIALSLNRNTAAARHRAALRRLRAALSQETDITEKTHVV